MLVWVAPSAYNTADLFARGVDSSRDWPIRRASCASQSPFLLSSRRDAWQPHEQIAAHEIPRLAQVAGKVWCGLSIAHGFVLACFFFFFFETRRDYVEQKLRAEAGLRDRVRPEDHQGAGLYGRPGGKGTFRCTSRMAAQGAVRTTLPPILQVQGGRPPPPSPVFTTPPLAPKIQHCYDLDVPLVENLGRRPCFFLPLSLSLSLSLPLSQVDPEEDEEEAEGTTSSGGGGKPGKRGSGRNGGAGGKKDRRRYTCLVARLYPQSVGRSFVGAPTLPEVGRPPKAGGLGCCHSNAPPDAAHLYTMLPQDR